MADDTNDKGEGKLHYRILILINHLGLFGNGCCHLLCQNRRLVSTHLLLVMIASYPMHNMDPYMDFYLDDLGYIP